MMGRSILVALLLALLGAGAAGAAGLPGEIGAQAPLGKNLTGDACQLRRVQSAPFSDAAERYQIRCDGWEEPSGRLVRLPTGRATTQWWIDKSPWVARLLDSANCEAAEPQPLLEGFEVLVRRCMHHSGWHQLILVAKAEGHFYLADFLPTNAPLVERSILVATGKRQLDQPPPQGTRLASLRAVEELIKSNQLTSTSDIGQFRKLYDYAISLNHLRDYRKAELAMRKALEVQERMLGPDNPALARTLHQLTHDLRNQRRLDATEEITKRAGILVDKEKDPVEVAHQFDVLAYNAGARQDKAAALEFAKQGAAVVNPLVKNQVGAAAEAYYVYGEYTPDLAEQEKLLRRSYDLYQQVYGVNYVWANRARMLLAKNLVKQNKLAEARPFIDLTLEKSELLFGRTIWWGNAKIAEAEYDVAAGNSAGALEAYRAYAGVAAKERYACYFGNCLLPYIDLLQGQAAKQPAKAAAFQSEAFAAAQLADSSVVFAAIDQLSARIAARDPQIAAIARDQQDNGEQILRTRAELAAELGKKAAERNAAREAELRHKVEALDAASAQQELQLQDRYPTYAQLLNRQAIGVAAVAKLLRPDEGLLVYTNLITKGYSFLIYKGQVQTQVVRVSKADLLQRVDDLRDGLTVKGQSLPDFDLQASYALFHDLFGELLAKGKHPGLKRLIVVPSSALLSLPPEVLVTAPPAKAGDYADAAWLVRDYAISVVPSVRAFVDLRKVAGVSRPDSGFIGIGNPNFTANIAAAKQGGSDDVCAERRNLRAVVAKLPALPETAQEIKTMAGEIGGKNTKLLLGNAATKSALQALPLDKAEIVAFATHGLLPDDLLCESEPALALTPGKESAADDDGLLKASDVTALRMNASLVILSACNTAGADGRLGGESLSGLVRAFFFAGSRNILATHWPIASQPTVQLTIGAIKAARKQHDDWAEGLREVKLQMLHNPQTAHPFFWGAFALIGAG